MEVKEPELSNEAEESKTTLCWSESSSEVEGVADVFALTVAPDTDRKVKRVMSSTENRHVSGLT